MVKRGLDVFTTCMADHEFIKCRALFLFTFVHGQFQHVPRGMEKCCFSKSANLNENNIFTFSPVFSCPSLKTNNTQIYLYCLSSLSGNNIIITNSKINIFICTEMYILLQYNVRIEEFANFNEVRDYKQSSRIRLFPLYL